MRRVLAVMLLALAASPLASAQTTGPLTGQGQTTTGTGQSRAAGPQGDDAVREALVAIERRAFEAIKNKNGPFFQSHLSEDSIAVGPGGVVRKAQIVKGISSAACEMKGYTMDNFDVLVLDQDAAILTYSVTDETACGGAAETTRSWASTVFVRRGGRWQAAFHQETPMQQPAQQQTTPTTPSEKKP